jgi:U1 small nuclear ribonucleoprotein
MPSDVLELFRANDISFLRAPVKPKCRRLDPVTTTCKDINAMFDIPNENLIDIPKGETREEKRLRIAQERKERNEGRIRNEIEEWNPFADEKITSDPEKTLIVARLSYKTTEKSLRFEFEVSLLSPRNME